MWSRSTKWPVRLSALLLLPLFGCPLTYSSSPSDAIGRQRIYRIDEVQAFAIARQALESTHPGAEIEEVSREGLVARLHGFRLVGSSGLGRTRYEVYPLRMKGHSSEGKRVTGYVIRVTSHSARVLGQEAGTSSIASTSKARLEKTRTGVWVSNPHRIPYESQISKPSPAHPK